MSFSLSLLDDYKGQNVATVGLKPIGKALASFTPEFITRGINWIIRCNLAEIVLAARAKARYRGGLMRQLTNYEMLGDMEGSAFSAAPYAFAQEKGFTTPRGGRVTANNFFMPASFNGMRQYVVDLKLWLQQLLAGAATTLRPIKPIPGISVKTKAPSAGTGVHRYTRKTKVGGYTRYYYASGTGTQSRFTKVLRPGVRKGFSGVGRRRRVV